MVCNIKTRSSADADKPRDALLHYAMPWLIHVNHALQ